MSDVFLTCRLLGRRTDAEKYCSTTRSFRQAGVLTEGPKNFLSPGRELFSASEDALLSNPGHFFLEIHDSLEANLTIVQLRGVQRKSLR